MHGNYDPVAPFYDILARAVFGNAIHKAQKFLLPVIPPESKILIVGGGTGRILEEICKLHCNGLSITYVEISAKMIARAKRRKKGRNNLSFINEAIQNFQLQGLYDVIITPFLLDNFSAETLRKVFRQLDNHLNKGGHWLFADFHVRNNKASQRFLLKLMYLFFNSLCGLETLALHDPHPLFRQYGYVPAMEKTFYRDFIRSVVYRKAGKILNPGSL